MEVSINENEVFVVPDALDGATIRHIRLVEASSTVILEFDLETDKEIHPESICDRCGRTNPVWTAPSPLWNEVMRGGDINGREQYRGIVCPSCFADLATKAGIASGWRLIATDVHAELQEVTPSGRVWNDETWLWEEQNTGSEPSDG